MRLYPMIALLTAAAAAGSAVSQERTDNVRQGPQTVFDRPVDQVLPELAGAAATGENGRVGNELVFWGYRLADGRSAYLYACALIDRVDCDARVRVICADDTIVLKQIQTSGDVSHRRCQRIAVASVGDRRPGCTVNEHDATLAVGLVQCQ